MAEISVQVVKELRQKTGAGMMHCKKALTETNGDITSAIAWLRQKNIASDTTNTHIAVEGLIGNTTLVHY